MMQTEVTNEILGFKWFIVSELFVGVLFIIAMFILTRKFGWERWKPRVFGGFFNLDDRMIWAIALLATRYIFVVSSVIFRVTMEGAQLAFMLGIVIIFNIIIFDISALLVDTTTYGVVFGALVVCNMFDRYVARVGGDLPILIVSTLMGVFIVLHSSYYSLITFQKIMAAGEVKNPGRERDSLVIIRKKLGIKEKDERAAIRAEKLALKAEANAAKAALQEAKAAEKIALKAAAKAGKAKGEQEVI